MSDRPRCLIVKRGLYSRPEGRGYTILKREAGRWPFGVPLSEGEVLIHEDEANDYSPGAYPDQVRADLERQIAALERTLHIWQFAWLVAVVGWFVAAFG